VQDLSCDLVFIDGVGALVSVAKPMQYIVGKPVASKHSGPVKRALLQAIKVFEDRGIKVNAGRFDREPAIDANRQYFERALPAGVNLIAATESEPIAERSARLLKNTARSVMASLPFKVPHKIVGELLKYPASRANTLGSSCLPRGVTPLELFTGRKADMKVELRFGFEDFGQAHFAKVGNTMAERTTGCIALRLSGNVEGSWKFLNLETEVVTTRQRFTFQPMPTDVIKRLNCMTGYGQPLVEDNAQQCGTGGEVIPGGGIKAAEAAAKSGIAGIDNVTEKANPDDTERRADEATEDANEPGNRAGNRRDGKRSWRRRTEHRHGERTSLR